MTVTQILKGLDKDIRSKLKPLFAVPETHRYNMIIKDEPRAAFKMMMLDKAWELQDERDRHKLNRISAKDQPRPGS